MPFEKILLGLDGSRNSEMASQWAFWLAKALGAELQAVYVNDPRFDDLFIEPEFAQELGFTKFVESSEKVSFAFHQIGTLILDFFKRQAEQHNIAVTTSIKQGQIVDELVSFAANFDLLIVGHRSSELPKLPVQLLLGNVSESICMQSHQPVLLAVQSPAEINEIVAGFDGSETSIEALLMAESLAKLLGRRLKAICVAPTKDDLSAARALADEGQNYLRESWEHQIFYVKEGPVSETIVNCARASNGLAIIGENGVSGGRMDTTAKGAFGSTALDMIKQDKSSVLIYKPTVHRVKKVTEQTSTFQSA